MGNVFAGFRLGTGVAATTRSGSRFFSVDGRRIFFTSAISLVPEDTNGALDAYEYDVATESVHLLSTGTSSSDSYFVNASANGDDAFIITRQRLNGWDTDDANDVYDVRVDGSIPEPPPPAPVCSGEACRSSTEPEPQAQTPGSSGLVGPEDQHPKRPSCGKHRHLVQRKGKSRCVKNAPAKQRRARHDRRNGR